MEVLGIILFLYSIIMPIVILIQVLKVRRITLWVARQTLGLAPSSDLSMREIQNRIET